jgi:hypothetical protein
MTTLSVCEFEFRTSETIISQHSGQEDRAYLKVNILRQVNTESPVLRVHHLVKVSYGVKCVSVANTRVYSTGILVSEHHNCMSCRSRWLCCLRRRCEVAWLLRSRVRIPLRSRMFVSYVCCVLCTQRSLWRAEHSFRRFVPTVCVCVALSTIHTPPAEMF